jgi:NAD(P)-dependent dehydrogenase (short-subunit alcohol dehydrogenase family)
VAATVERHGRLDIVVNNAGTTQVIAHHDLDAVTTETWERILRVNARRAPRTVANPPSAEISEPFGRAFGQADGLAG